MIIKKRIKKLEELFFAPLPSLSFSLSSFLLFLLEDLLWEDWDVPVCPAPLEPPESVAEPEFTNTLLPQRAQERSCRSTGETPSSTRKLTWSRKYNTAGKRINQRKYIIKSLVLFYSGNTSKCLTIIFHAELLPVDCPLSGNFSTGL